jgi:SAM-dependent methyltransferase
MHDRPPAYRGCAIPPEVHAVGFGWDPRPEVDRLLLLARDAGVTMRRALELGCGTGRLLACIRESVDEAIGLELSPTAAEYARSQANVEVHIGDMAAFDLPGRFDLIYASANTIRHVRDDDSVRRMWNCIADHLSQQPGGVFIADLELGAACEAERVGKPATWIMSRGEMLVRVRWAVVEPPAPGRPVTTIEWSFESRGVARPGTWSERFDLRAYEPREFLAMATADGRLECTGLHEPRDPYLVPRTLDRASGRTLVALQRKCLVHQP